MASISPLESKMLSRSFLATAVGAWLAILFFAVGNGGLREGFLMPSIGAPWAHLLSGVSLSACILGVAWLFTAKFRDVPSWRFLAVGALWLAMTLVFEFGFGLLVQGKPWSDIWVAYTFRDGNIWPVVLLVVLIAPWAASRRRRSQEPHA